jgi:hypothetical protein
MLHNLRRAVGGTIVQNNHAVGAQRLTRDGIEGLFDELLAVANGYGGEDF